MRRRNAETEKVIPPHFHYAAYTRPEQFVPEMVPIGSRSYRVSDRGRANVQADQLPSARCRGRVKIHRRDDAAGESALPPTADEFLQRRKRGEECQLQTVGEAATVEPDRDICLPAISSGRKKDTHGSPRSSADPRAAAEISSSSEGNPSNGSMISKTTSEPVGGLDENTIMAAALWHDWPTDCMWRVSH